MGAITPSLRGNAALKNVLVYPCLWRVLAVVSTNKIPIPTTTRLTQESSLKLIHLFFIGRTEVRYGKLCEHLLFNCNAIQNSFFIIQTRISILSYHKVQLGL